MKLLVAFVHASDVMSVSGALRTAGHRFTRLASVGGFLGEESATFLLAVEDEHVDDVRATFEGSAVGRDVEVPLDLRGRLEDWRAATVRHRGATILVADLERVIQT